MATLGQIAKQRPLPDRRRKQPQPLLPVIGVVLVVGLILTNMITLAGRDSLTVALHAQQARDARVLAGSQAAAETRFETFQELIVTTLQNQPLSSEAQAQIQAAIEASTPRTVTVTVTPAPEVIRVPVPAPVVVTITVTPPPAPLPSPKCTKLLGILGC